MTAVDDAAALLAGGRVVAFTGAGISAESGIPTFRDPGGLWDAFDPETFGTWDGLARSALERPDALADFLAGLRRVFAAAKPGAAHHALATLGDAGIVYAVVTQNVDGLHQEAGSANVLEIHGSFRRLSCLLAGHRSEISRDDLVESLDRAVMGLRTAFVPSLASLLPRCGACGAPARPDFVAFGEAVQEFAEAETLVRSARVLLVVGTSGEVFPAAHLPEVARESGTTVVEVAGGESFIRSDLRLDGRAGTLLPALVEATLSRL